MKSKMFLGTPKEIYGDGTVKPKYFFNLDFVNLPNVERMARDIVDEFGKDVTYEEVYFFAEHMTSAKSLNLAASVNALYVKIHSKHAKVFTFSEALISALENTRVPKHLPEIRLPFPSVVIDEWTFVEKHGVIRGVRLFKDDKDNESIDFIRIEDEEGYSIIRKRCGTLINMLLYLTSEKPDFVPETRKFHKKKGSKRGVVRDVIYVGKRYHHVRNPSHTGIKISCRFMVRGHWRNQYITGGHKRIFIEPHWKGPDMAEVVNKVYEVR